jgi:hypothetical protein
MTSEIKDLKDKRITPQFADEKPFTTALTDDVAVSTDDVMISVRLNLEEQTILKGIKEALNISSDGMALKVSARLGLNVIRSHFTPEFLDYLTREKRARLRKK